MAPALWATRWWRSNFRCCRARGGRRSLRAHVHRADRAGQVSIANASSLWPSTHGTAHASANRKALYDRILVAVRAAAGRSGRGMLVQRTDEQQCMEYGP